MKNIRLRAEERLIEQARQVARSQHKTLNTVFREWLIQLTSQTEGTQVESLMEGLRHVQAGRHFSRDEMNQR